MSGMALSTEEMKHFGIRKDQVLSRRESMTLSEPRLFVILCSVSDAEEIVKNHPNVTLASFGEYSNRGKRGMLRAPKGTVLGPVGGFYRARDV